ncbi:MAG TPA: GNAT family N-acetyltransferase [Noviherbaspirillum sp.]|nr:GNAT family N-acetyltransferase [Noviherbaspirillum sp.]
MMGYKHGSAVVASAHVGLARAADDADVEVKVYENSIPPFAEREMERLYGSFYASMPQLEIEGSTRGVSTWVASRHGEIIELWLYRIEGREVRVLNEAITVTAAAVRRFADTVFAGSAALDAICFNAIYPALDGLALPCQRVHCTDDTVIVLPRNEEAWLAALGKTTRKNMRRYMQRFTEAFPGYRYRVYERDAIPEAHVRAIIAFNRARMTAKGKVSGVDAEQEARILKLVRRCGLIGVATIDDRIVGGAIVYQVGANYFSYLRAHDPAYNDYRLGLIGGYELVRTCIGRGGRELHLMWGREPHKLLLGGEQRELDRVVVYRSRLRALRHLHRIAHTAWASRTRAARAWLTELAARREGPIGHLLHSARGVVRRLRR